MAFRASQRGGGTANGKEVLLWGEKKGTFRVRRRRCFFLRGKETGGGKTPFANQRGPNPYLRGWAGIITYQGLSGFFRKKLGGEGSQRSKIGGGKGLSN